MSASLSQSRFLIPTDNILNFWFEHLDDAHQIDMASPQCRRWHAKDVNTDTDITRRFADVYRAARQPGAEPEEMTARERLARVLLFDQFTRNMFRDKPTMYEADADALRLAETGIARHDDEALPLIYRMFLYMPLMHSENLGHQDRTVELFKHLLKLTDERSPINRGFFQMAVGYAVQHRDIVAQFGRFPHRNGILGRPSTPEEMAFLEKAGSSF